MSHFFLLKTACPTINSDGTITYWDIFTKRFVTTYEIAEENILAMEDDDQVQVRKFLNSRNKEN